MKLKWPRDWFAVLVLALSFGGASRELGGAAQRQGSDVAALGVSGPPPAGTAQLAGVVLEADGATPVAGAVVHVIPGAFRIYRATTDAAGRYL